MASGGSQPWAMAAHDGRAEQAFRGNYAPWKKRHPDRAATASSADEATGVGHEQRTLPPSKNTTGAGTSRVWMRSSWNRGRLAGRSRPRTSSACRRNAHGEVKGKPRPQFLMKSWRGTAHALHAPRGHMTGHPAIRNHPLTMSALGQGNYQNRRPAIHKVTSFALTRDKSERPRDHERRVCGTQFYGVLSGLNLTKTSSTVPASESQDCSLTRVSRESHFESDGNTRNSTTL